VAVVREIAPNQPAEVQLALESFLSQIPPAVRQSLRRPEDPTGTTIAAGRRFGKPEELVQVLPQRLARFKPGDRPLAGVSWELVELLGVGGFGEVWKARHTKMTSRKPVALKFCLGLDTHGVEALKNEMALVDRVMGQGVTGIVPLVEAYLEAEPFCLAYQLIEGGDLTGYLQERSGLSWEQATRAVLALARTMSGPHGMSPFIVHRDLKPANILVERTADGTIKLWVADFGIGGASSAHTLKQEKSRRISHQQSLPSALRGS
jgi:serine/threonine protein kinase